MPRFPKLAGQPAMYLEKQIRDFLTGARANDGGQMTAVVTELAPEDITGVAVYFAMLPTPVPSNDAPTEAQAGVANVLVEHGRPQAGLPACRSCHLPGAAVPQLEAQHRAYLVKQLSEFRSGGRINDLTGSMTDIARQLSESDIEALATYFAARPRPPAPN
jgi:cytochrome c553